MRDIGRSCDAFMKLLWCCADSKSAKNNSATSENTPHHSVFTILQIYILADSL